MSQFRKTFFHGRETLIVKRSFDQKKSLDQIPNPRFSPSTNSNQRQYNTLEYNHFRHTIRNKEHVNITMSIRRFSTNRILRNDTIITNGDGSIREIAIHKLDAVNNELKYFDMKLPESITPNSILQVSKLFDWLYTNKQYDLAYQLVKSVLPNYNLFFNFGQCSKIIEIFDKIGTPNDLYTFFEVFKYDKIPIIWKSTENLSNDPYIKDLMNLTDMIIFDDTKPILNRLLLENEFDGLKYFTLRIVSTLYSNFDKISQLNLYDYLTNLDSKMNIYFPPNMINQLFVTFNEINNPKFDQQYEFLKKYFDVHYDNTNINESSFQYKLISALSKLEITTLRFKFWYEYCYDNEKLRYNREIQPIIYLRNNKLHFLPKNFEKDLKYDNNQLSNVFSVLIYTHSKYENNTYVGQIFYHLKIKLKLTITKPDKIGYLKALTTDKQFAKAKTKLKKFIKEDPDFESDETLHPILIILARTKDWDELEKIYTTRYENNEVITKDQYITLFTALSIRPGTHKVMMSLWENYLKRGFEPNDQILSSIIQSYVNTKSYEDALQWFTAYSHYKVNLTPKSYGLMMQSLAYMNEIQSVYMVLDELVKKEVRLPKAIFIPIFTKFAEMGDYKSIEYILKFYYPKFNLNIERIDSRFIMKSHFHANRFDIIIDNYMKMKENEIFYQDSVLALDSAIKCKDIKLYEHIWKKASTIAINRGDIDDKAYVSYMAYWVRKNGSFGVDYKLKEIKETLKIDKLPSMIFNQMIFSALRTNRPWLTKKFVNYALINNVSPTPKMYSLVLQSNVSMPWIARNSIDETITILDDVLTNRKNDKFGLLNADLNPMSFKLVIKAVIKYKDIFEARKLFEAYLETSRNTLTNNIHILNIELMLLGEEERWIEFDEKYETYLEMITKLNENSRFKDSQARLDKIEDRNEFSRLDSQQDINLRSYYDDNKVKKKPDARVKIPNWIKKSHYDIWIYRLRQLETADKLNEVTNIVGELIQKGIVMSNKNLNETALFLSERIVCLEEAATFIDKYLLPIHIRNQQFKRVKLKYTTDLIPFMKRKPEYEFRADVYYDVIKNLSIALSERLSYGQRLDLMKTLRRSSNKYILHNLEHLLKERRHIRSSYLQTKSMRRIFYREQRRQTKISRQRAKRKSMLNKLEVVIKGRQRCKELLDELKYLTDRIQDKKLDFDVRKEIEQQQREVRGRIRAVHRETRKQVREAKAKAQKEYNDRQEILYKDT